MDVMELLKTRRTYRRFKQEPISKEILDDILLSTRYVSSGANRQPISYVVVNDPAKVAEVFSYTKWAGMLPPELGMPKENERPVLFIAVVENTDINPNADTDAGLALSNLTMAAWSHGVGSCIIGACDKPSLSKMFGLTDKQVLHTVVAFGYPSHTSTIVDLPEGDTPKYYLDDNKDYFVQKRTLEETVRFL